MGPLKRVLVLLLFPFLLFGTPDQHLKRGDVKETFDEMLSIHVEHGKINPTLYQRSMKVYIEQFDGSKMYLLGSEVRSSTNLSKKQMDRAAARYQGENYADFEQLNTTITRAIKRSRAWRKEIQSELILSYEEAEEARPETYLSFAKSEEGLKTRLKKQLTRILAEERRINQLDNWTPEDREKIFLLWESRFQRGEEPYLGKKEKKEHYQSLHTLRALAKSLDAHSAYFSPAEANEMRTSLEKQFEGVGVILRESIYGIQIVDLVKGGPAERSKQVFIGDRIVKINGVPVASMTYEQMLEAMKGTGAKELILTLQSPEEPKQREVLLIRERIMMNDERLNYETYPISGGNIGIMNLPSFYEGGHQSSAERDMREAIKKMKKEGELKGIILDMRENAGGFLTQAVKIAGLFVSRGVIVISKYARGEIKYLRNLDGRLLFDGPMIILTSRASASAAEIVAQALQDYGTALIVGDKQTYGKGTIQYQTVTDKSAKSFYKVTVGRYYTVSGRSTQIEGVKADIVVPTIFSSYKIGERFLEYPLQSDQVAAAYIDPLSDIDYRSRAWFQKNYLPNLHKPQEKWQKHLPQLQANSAQRLEKDQNFTLFIKSQEKLKGRSPRSFQRVSNPPWGQQDLQMQEAIHIMQDMVALPES